MRTRAGIILVQDDQVALIERHRGGLEYYVFPGGGVEEGETPEEGAIREAMEEMGIDVSIIQKAVIVHFGQSTQIYYLAEQTGGEFGTGTGEEFTDENLSHPFGGVYIPVWMPIAELSRRTNVHPAGVVKLVLKAQTDGWGKEPVEIWEEK